nr:sigma-54-dependent Fis family transcriptional regulator [Deltaproteobacteria bacterium]
MDMHKAKREKQLLHTFLATLLKLQNVKRGSVWIKNRDSFACVEAMGDQSERIKGITISTSQPSIVRSVIESGRMVIAKPGEDARHFRQMEDDLEVKSTLILAFPLIMKDGNVYGTVELIDTSARGEALNLKKDYLELLQNLVTIGSEALSNFLDYQIQLTENQKLKKTLDILQGGPVIVGRDPRFLAVLDKVHDYAGVDFPVLITGESGTGKEIIAKELHRLSTRAAGPFLIQNCSAIPETLLESELFGYKRGSFTGATTDKIGLFEAAHGGTVFLDEIGDMSFNLQARILRVVQDNEVKPIGGTETTKVDVRIISATNVDLTLAIAEKRFREDLYYRLNVLPLEAPPLRERKEDIPLLLEFFLKRECARLGLGQKRLSPAALARLMGYSWPGNIRELENFIKYMIVSVSGPTITTSDLPNHVGPKADQVSFTVCTGPVQDSGTMSSGTTAVPVLGQGTTWEEVEKMYINSLLEKSRWSVTKASQLAGVKRSTFYARMRKLGIQR